MTNIYYRLCNTDDPEERLEDAALYKALFDQFGAGLTLVNHDAPAPLDGLFLGRGRNNEFNHDNLMASSNIEYWKDRGFLDHIARSFIVTDLEGARKEVARIHASGKDAFLKSTRQKHMVSPALRGQGIHEALGDWVWSFIDRPDCLMVQEHVEMSWERRFLVMNGKVMTHSPVAWHLTPMSRYACRDETGFDIDDLHYKTPGVREARFSPTGSARMLRFAQQVADTSDEPHLCIDLAIIGDDLDRDPIEVIEFNPMQPGAVGLYACDPRAVARGVYEALDPEMRKLADARKAGLAAPGEIPSVPPSITDALTGKESGAQKRGDGAKKFTSFEEFELEDEPFEDIEFEDESPNDEPASP
ncbi:hypothetical protein [Pseudosulfitobacter pseudonitzschiae]|uniref:hypothetical protein n=1 Tax=Pseudosulfitobacter pseudonitzschiae TaxID=1402135 RepID=UPI003B7C91E2